MSKKSTIARCVGAAAATAGALALVAPGIASADPVAEVPAPKISANVVGGVIDMTVTQTSTGQNSMCLPIVLNATDALPLAALPTDQWPGFGELISKVYYVGNPTSDAEPTVESTTGGEGNTGLIKEITPGAYAVVGACFDATAQDAVLSYSYQVVFSPGGFGSLGQALDLGSATINMDGGSAIIADLLKSGAGSSMLSANLS
ncbi:hypothetical protein C8K36_109140 [Rhodococcus sp. OK519]|uniref:hypothetical protein n=1 Tax=Rhodococcus sp. OK519 TaxID=2135729 RepID=UPI000D371D24|nr:hypothetical protein C8K36_109140 [Rhodococcus sp. OK519]